MSQNYRSKGSKTHSISYPESFKKKIVNEVLSGKLNKRQASLIYGIKGHATILSWINQSTGLKDKSSLTEPVATFRELKKNIDIQKLEEEAKELKELLRVAELRADLWQHAIETAEKKFNIHIVKKYGAQQSTPSRPKGQKRK
jgi:transposase